MPGLLDFLNSDDAKLGIGLLSAGGPSAVPMSFGQRLQGAMQTMDADKQNKAKLDLVKAQIADSLAQSEQRTQQAAQIKRRNDLVNNWLTQMDGSVPQANDAVVSATGNLAPTIGNATLQTQAMGRINASNPISGIPREAITSDLAFNDGKNIPEWMFKRGVPDIQVSNGYAYDKNRVQPGFMPGVSTSANGQTSVTMPDGNGGVRVFAPGGALDTFSAYSNATEKAKADFDPVQVYNPQTRAMEFVPRSQVVGSQAAPAAAPSSGQPVYTGNFKGDPQQIAQAIAQIRDPQERANAMSALQEQLARGGFQGAPTRSGARGVQAAPSAEQAAAAEALKAGSAKQATDNVQPLETRRNSIANINQIIGTIDQVANHPALARATGLQGWVDPRNYIPGTAGKDFKVAASQLQGQAFLGAYERLRGSGQISNIEGAKAEDALARLSAAQTTESYRSALDDFRKVMVGALKRAEMAMPAGEPTHFDGDMRPGATGSWAPSGKKSAIGAGGWSATEIGR